MDEFICRDRAFCLGGDSHLVEPSRFSILSLRLMVDPIYQPRNPKISLLYQSIVNHFAEFDSLYEERYQKRYGVLRDVVREVVITAPHPHHPSNPSSFAHLSVVSLSLA
jgi:hypothetical protein